MRTHYNGARVERVTSGGLRVVRLSLLALPISCLAPTEITLSITTDAKCADLQGVAIALGPTSEIDTTAALTVTPQCGPDGTIGTLALVPRSIDDVVGIRVVAGFKKPADACVAPFGDGCIVARRSLRYVPHTPLFLPIELSVSCSGVPCDTTSTCVAGQCVPANIPDPTTCATPNGCLLNDGGAPLAFDPECGDLSGAGGGSRLCWPGS